MSKEQFEFHIERVETLFHAGVVVVEGLVKMGSVALGQVVHLCDANGHSVLTLPLQGVTLMGKVAIRKEMGKIAFTFECPGDESSKGAWKKLQEKGSFIKS